jgi:hypothetical protein
MGNLYTGGITNSVDGAQGTEKASGQGQRAMTE